MGFLALSLSFVSITLLLNGMCRLRKIDARSTAFFNVFTGLLLFLGNAVALTTAADHLAYQNITSGMLFAVTYLLIASMNLFKVDARIFGWFCLWATVYAVVMACTLWNVSLFLCVLWIMWAILWFSSYVEIILKVNNNKLFSFILLAEGIFATGIPAFMIFLFNM